MQILNLSLVYLFPLHSGYCNMKSFTLVWILWVLASGQKSGSIFNTLSETEIVNEDPSDAETTTSETATGEPLTTSSTTKTTGSDEVTETNNEDPTGEDDTVPVGDGTISDESSSVVESESSVDEELEEKQKLTEENEEIEQNIESLEDQVAKTIQEVEYYRYMEAEILKNYAEQMENLTKQIDELEGESSGSEQSDQAVATSSKQTSSSASVIGINTGSSSDEGNHYDSEEISLIMISVIGLGFLFLLLHNIRKMWLLFPAIELYSGVYTLLVDATILVIIWCVVAILEYLDAVDLEIYTILVGLVIFTFFWLLLGLWVLFLINLQSNKWRVMEKKMMIAGEKDQDLKDYMTMRQLFITPVYTAPVTETELSPRFDFSVYLSKCLGQIVQTSLRITWIGYFIIIFCIICWRTLAEESEFLEIISLWVLPVILTMMILIMLFKMHRIYKALVPVSDDFDVSLHKNPNETEVRSNIPKPSYLRGRVPENILSRFICISFNPFKLTCAWLFLSRFPNRHELQFWFDSYGPTFLGIMIQVISVLHTLWITAIILYYFPVFVDEAESYGIYLVLLGIAVWMANGFYLFPKLLVYLCLVSKVELMKERTLIEDTADFSKKQMVDKTVKIYRQLKMIYREVKGMDEGEEKTEILDYMKKISEEVFLLFSDSDQSIHATQLDDVLSLLGVRLREDELRLFAKECSPDKDNFVSLHGFLMAIERILTAFDLNPGEVVSYILLNYFKKSRKMTVADLTDFFDEWSWHFSDEIIDEFLLESQTLADDSGHFRPHDVGNLVKVYVEACPK